MTDHDPFKSVVVTSDRVYADTRSLRRLASVVAGAKLLG